MANGFTFYHWCILLLNMWGGESSTLTQFAFIYFFLFKSRHYLCPLLISLSYHKKVRIGNEWVFEASINGKMCTVTIAMLALMPEETLVDRAKRENSTWKKS